VEEEHKMAWALWGRLEVAPVVLYAQETMPAFRVLFLSRVKPPGGRNSYESGPVVIDEEHRRTGAYPSVLKDSIAAVEEMIVLLRKANPTVERSEGREQTTARARKLRWEAEAMSLKAEHPDWSNAKIAELVGRHKSTLGRSKTYKTAAALAGEHKPPPNGSKDKEGNTEAIDEDESEDDGADAEES
jgi:hypothetical protein